MAYYLSSFITTAIPAYDQVLDDSPARARDAIINTIAGGYDSDGDQDATAVLPYELSCTSTILATSQANWRAEVDKFRALVRKTGRLYRKAIDDNTIQWCKARLVAMPTVQGPHQVLWTKVNFRFQVRSLWVGADHTPWVLDSGEIFDGGLYLDEAGFTETMASSPHTITVTNGGNRVVTNPVVTITAGGANITAATIAKTGETKIVWSGTLTAGNDLVIDCGKFTITNNGANAYSGKAAFDSNHTIAEWLRLDPGNNDIDVTFTGGSTDSTVTVEFRDGWA